MTYAPFPATRTDALARLNRFVARAGAPYSKGRNTDFGPGAPMAVSGLSPYIRARCVSETEVLDAVLARYSLKSAEKFIQEVFWRTYWKGWLEMRPSVWGMYQAGLNQSIDQVQTQSGLRRAFEDACLGRSGIACFDAWATELVQTGYLHNHARMWFASIWIFTLRLPWELGADFFLRHLLDGDPASNTLSWRWVAGLQTRGKAYVARAENIARYTNGRFHPVGELNENPVPLNGPDHPQRRELPTLQEPDFKLKTAFILHDEDLSPHAAMQGIEVCASASLTPRSGLSPLHVAPAVCGFADDLTRDCIARWGARLGPVTPATTALDLADWAARTGAAQIVTPYAPVGPVADILSDLALRLTAQGQRLVQRQTPYDTRAWPYATHGFFRFKDAIPKLIAAQKGWG